MKKENVVVATLKTWNTRNYYKLKKTMKDFNWYLIEDKSKLNYIYLFSIKPKYVFLPHWSWKIPGEVYNNFECVAFHMSDLPFGRGGSPLQNLIVKGFKKTRISAFKVNEEVDAGPIYLKKDLSLEGSADEIFKRASKIIFNEMVPYIIKNNPKPTPQKGKSTIFKRRNPEESNIGKLNDLDKIFDYIRMLDAEGYPPAFVKINNLKIEFSNAKIKDNSVMATAKIKLKDLK